MRRVLNTLRALSTELVRRSFRRSRIRLPQPWSRLLGQLVYLPRLVSGHEPTRRTFVEETAIERLARSAEPLERVGAGLSERVVEVPWAMRRLSLAGGGVRALDIGTAFAPIVYKRLLSRLDCGVEVADLAAADIPGLRSHVADVRKLPFATGSYDFAICISTLEHIGLDNRQYAIESGGEGDVQALRELGRVARRVLVTVPAGRDLDMGWQRQYAPSSFRRAAEEAGLEVVSLEIFAHERGSGWSPAPERAIAELVYGEGSAAAAAIICAELTAAGS